MPFLKNESHTNIWEYYIAMFKLFCKKNATMPYKYKKRVLHAVIMSSVLYGYESWLTEQTTKVEKLYMGVLKTSRGVKETTCTDVVLLETGMPTLKDLICKITAKFEERN